MYGKAVLCHADENLEAGGGNTVPQCAINGIVGFRADIAIVASQGKEHALRANCEVAGFEDIRHASPRPFAYFVSILSHGEDAGNQDRADAYWLTTTTVNGSNALDRAWPRASVSVTARRRIAERL